MNEKQRKLEATRRAVALNAKKQKVKRRMAILESLVLEYYVTEGVGKVRKEAGKLKYYVRFDAVVEIAERLGLRREKKQDIPDHLGTAQDTIERYNERYATAFYLNYKGPQSFVEDNRTARYKDLQQGLIFALYNDGYSITKRTEVSFYIE